MEAPAMTIEGALLVLLMLVVLFAIGFLAKWVIDTFFPAPIHAPALLIVGVILLIVLILVALRWAGVSSLK
jgi:hypothetical protein